MTSSQTLEYAPKGLIGVLTPQANTTVEPEFSILCPPGNAFINARLTSPKETIEERLIDYTESLEGQISQFANAPVAALAFAATGGSYLIGKDEEDRLVERVRRSRGVPLITSARAVCDALSTLGASRIALISPYPEGLTVHSVAYWKSRDLDVMNVVSAFEDGGMFHPIYALGADKAGAGLGALRDSGAEAIVMLGTGMPTLAPIAAHAGWDGPPILSCMLALVWRSVLASAGRSPGKLELLDWIAAKHWAERLAGFGPASMAR
jgi:maleate isomerase